MPLASELHQHMELLRFKTFFKDVIIGLFSGPHAHPMVLHELSAINSFKKRKTHVYPHLSGCPATSRFIGHSCLIHLSFKSEEPHHDLGLPSFDPVHCLHCPGQNFIPKAKYWLDIVNQTSTLDPPWNVLFPVNLDVFPERLVCRLHQLHPKSSLADS